MDQGSIDSLIRAVAIGKVRIAAMFIDVGNADHNKQLIPRIEGQFIDSIEIGSMNEGVVWSGIWDEANLWTGDNEPENDYALIDAIEVGCVGPGSDIWFKGTPTTFIAEDLLGELHVTTLAESELIRIGGKLGDAPIVGSPSPGDVCGVCTNGDCAYFTSFLQDDSPRGTGYADEGAIFVTDDVGLEGQIVINGDVLLGSDPTAWKGRVVVGSTTPITVAPASLSATQPNLAPYYDRTAASLGGGAIGLGSYGLHGADCTPPHNALDRDEGVSQREFEDPDAIPVIAQSYGPMFLPEEEVIGDFVVIEVQSPTNPCFWTDTSSMFQIVLHPDLNNNSQVDPAERRYIGLKQNGHIPVPGIYRLNCYLHAEYVAGPSEVAWPAWVPPPTICGTVPVSPAYVFRIWPDCDDDGLNDLIEIDGNSSLDTDNDDVLDSCESSCHVCDVNSSGAVTVQDIFDFLAAFFINPACIGPVPATTCSGATLPGACAGVDADVNNNCTVSVQDIFDFLSCYFASQGSCPP